MKNLIIGIIFLLANINNIFAQEQVDNYSATISDSSIVCNNKTYKVNAKKIILATTFISYGVASLSMKKIKQINFSTKQEIFKRSPYHTKFDNYTQYVPVVFVYGLNMAGVNGKHNFRDRSIIYASSQLVLASLVSSIKHITKVERPDGSNNLSFPSGHTATAFSAAHFMFREYKDNNFCLSLSGYPFAIFTGTYRIINNKHWLGDVIGGAGIGILSTEIAYWLYPKINEILKSKKNDYKTIIFPYYQDKTFGLSLAKNF